MSNATLARARNSAGAVLTLALGASAWMPSRIGPSEAMAGAPERTSTTVPFEVESPPEAVFDLFLPSQRAAWDHDWEIEILSPPGCQEVPVNGTFRRLDDCPSREPELS